VNLLVVSCSHQTAGLDIREKIAFSGEQLQPAYLMWRKTYPDAELVVLSTCNRVEIYAADESSEPAVSVSDVADFLAQFHNVPTDAFFDALLSHHGADAVTHLFQVACSIDSMVLGEPQIVNQVKQAYETAQTNQGCGPLTNVMFQHALGVSARVRSETGLAQGRVSIASVAVGEFGRSVFNRFDNKTVLVIGAGEMAEESLRYLRDEGVRKIIVVNRSLQRATALAERFDGQAVPFEQLDQWLGHADVIVSATGSDQVLITRERFAKARQQFNANPVFILDLAAPRDFDPAIESMDDNVFLFDIDSLEATCERNRKQRESEIASATQIISDQTDRFMQEIYHRATGPVIHRLREHWNSISQAELDRLYRKLPELAPEHRMAVEATIQRIVNKLLHPPLEALKDEAREGTPAGLLQAIRRLFLSRDE
jgi:glutamyl-tRNA reductase